MKKILAGLLCLFAWAVIVPVQAQNPVTITVGMASFYQDLLKTPIENFNAAHEDIQIQLTEASLPYYGAGIDAETYLDDLSAAVSEADIFFAQSSQLPLVATRSGYILDIAPLVTADTSLNPSDFYGSMWRAFQWEGGMWAMPMTGDVIGILYDQDAFDEANLPYPGESWSMIDMETAAREFATYDENGDVEAPGVYIYASSDQIINSMLDNLLYDPVALEATPNFDDPALAELMTTWAELTEEGLIGTPTNSILDLPPVSISPSILSILPGLQGGDTSNYQFTSLPGGSTFIDVAGLAVSAGTLSRDAAYEVVKFLTTDLESVSSIVSSPIPALRELTDMDADTGIAALANISLPEDLLSTILAYVESAKSPADLLFSPYVAAALQNVQMNDALAEDALNEVEVTALDAMTAATNRQGDVVTVNAPGGRVLAPAGENDVNIKFGYYVLANAIPNQEELENFMVTYAEETSGVANVELERLSVLSGAISLANFADQVDCFYYSGNLVGSEDMSLLLPLDPLLDSDPNLNRNDVVGDVLSQLQFNGQTYALPIHLQPELIAYVPSSFEASGVPFPDPTWTTADFELALQSLQTDTAEDAPFGSRSIGGTYLLSLIASYGGLPLDTSTTPITLDFTSDSSVAAIRQVLDLAKEGYIHYSQMGDLAAMSNISFQDTYPMYAFLMSPIFNFAGTSEDVGYVPYPRGNMYTPVTYDIGAAYIIPNTGRMEACYDFISELARHPEFFGGMPAWSSELDNPVLATTQSEEATAYYEAFADTLSQPDHVEFQSMISSQVGVIDDLITSIWLYRAFDAYVLEDADLVAELEQAQVYAQDFITCAGALPPFESGTDDVQEYTLEYVQCAIDTDSSMSELFGAVGVN
ncbi:extracellular solute-binding protein [Phototrophicus methaneseepsis]|uniref:Extracellular solute-binding protein n=1 Tax=Phototrophicus methaneseepsis TaxID=2710758 RepID=A0A7S8EAC8_9CHLR|nr:extracellular solute-binding protein [Phototrophicus methaneseepsis]QPC83285.1 extracellular solute-binding protein [Phototrophicus methaneseepsis]